MKEGEKVKNEIKIKGQLIMPIRIGMPAYIHEDSCIRRTSAVVAICAQSKRSMMFKTQNSIYLLEVAKMDGDRLGINKNKGCHETDIR